MRLDGRTRYALSCERKETFCSCLGSKEQALETSNEEDDAWDEGDQIGKGATTRPSAAAVRWDAARSADDYIQQASTAIGQTEARLSMFRELALPDEWFKQEIFKAKKAEEKFYEAQRQLEETRNFLPKLLDKQNWASERPQVSVEADINQAGNLAVHWTVPYPPLLIPPRYRLKNTTGLRDDFFRKSWYRTDAYSGPPTLLLRFRDVPLRWHSDERDHPAVRFIIYAIRAKFEAVVNDLGQSLEVVTSPRIGFTRDDEAGLEMTIFDE